MSRFMHVVNPDVEGDSYSYRVYVCMYMYALGRCHRLLYPRVTIGYVHRGV